MPKRKSILSPVEIELLKLDFATKQDLENSEARVSHKLDKIITMLDGEMGELVTVRQEQVVTAHQLQGHEDRIQAIESN